jgi:hypothetical protein
MRKEAPSLNFFFCSLGYQIRGTTFNYEYLHEFETACKNTLGCKSEAYTDRFMKKPVVKNFMLLSLSQYIKKQYQNENYFVKFYQDDQIFAIKDSIFLNKKKMKFSQR